MNKTKACLLITLWAIFVKGKKHYVCPAVNTLLILLEKFHDTRIQRRWLFYCLADLRSKKFIRMKRRYTHTEDNLIRQIPSMIALTAKGVQYMQRRFVGGARELYGRMISWLNKGEHRFPGAADMFPDDARTDPEMAIQKIRTLIKDIG